MTPLPIRASVVIVQGRSYVVNQHGIITVGGVPYLVVTRAESLPPVPDDMKESYTP